MEKRVLVVSSDDNTAREIHDALSPTGCEVAGKGSIKAALRSMTGEELVVLDLPKAGLEALKEVKAYHPGAYVLMMDGADCLEHAVKLGAYDCLRKPLEAERLRLVARNAFYSMYLGARLRESAPRETPDLLVRKNLRMRQVARRVEQLCRKDANVLIVGENGTGKELVARAIHEGSFRRNCEFLNVDGSERGFPASLFGGAVEPARIMAAAGGTLYVRDLPPLEGPALEGLAMLAREKTFRPGMNGAEPVRADVRMICSVTGGGDARIGSPLAECFQAVLNLPALRDRKEDIIPLAGQFLMESAEVFRTGPKRLGRETIEALKRHDWPGNVSELKNTMRKACLLAPAEEIEPRHLAMGKGAASHCSAKEFLQGKLQRYIKDIARLKNAALYEAVLSEFERGLLELVLEGTGGNQMQAASALGITRTTLRSKIRKYKIKVAAS